MKSQKRLFSLEKILIIRDLYVKNTYYIAEGIDMVFVYLILLGVLAFSWKAKEKASKRVWMLAFTAFFLAFVIFIYHSLSPLEVHL